MARSTHAITRPPGEAPFHALPVSDVASAFGSDTDSGLSRAEAAARSARAGANELPPPRRERLPRRIARQLVEPMALLLIAAASVAWFGLEEPIDTAAILTIVVANAMIALLQEGKAARALEALRSMQVPQATVRREGERTQVAAREIAPGDVVELAQGDRVPADIRLTEVATLEIDEAILTGESLPLGKVPDATVAADAPIADRRTMAFAGTMVTRGSGLGIAVAIGAATHLGAIAERLREPRAATPLQRELRRLTTRLGAIAIAVAVGVFVLTLARADAATALLSGVALAVAAVPQGLPTVVTVGLALGVQRMAARGAIIRRLPAVETLGSTSMILTDKTGTLTENRMRLDAVMTPGRGWEPLGDAPAIARVEIAEVLALCNDASLDPPLGDPMEIAMLEAIGADQVARLRAANPRIGVVPFDADLRRMSTTNRGAAGGTFTVVKGAPEAVLPLTGGDLLHEAGEMAGRGARVLALARAEGDGALALVGLVALRDPVRPEAAAAAREARDAGIGIAMVTGDHPGTAAAIAAEIGLEDPGGTGPLARAVHARIDPEGKLALVEAARAEGHVVAVTGDGVNDAPALRRADIGVAMGRTGSDVAREASDMIVTDDNLATIVAAVREGRGIYDNIRKVVDYLVAGNLSEIMVVVTGLLAFPALGVPLLPLQLLWINLLTDGLPAIAFGADRTDPVLMRRPPRTRRDGLLGRRTLALLTARASLIAAVSLGSLAVARFVWNEPWESARAQMFSVLVGAHLLYAFAARHPRDGRARSRPGPWLAGAVVLSLLLQLAVVTLAPLQRVFSTTALAPRGWALVLAGSILPWAVMSLVARRTARSASP